MQNTNFNEEVDLDSIIIDETDIGEVTSPDTDSWGNEYLPESLVYSPDMHVPQSFIKKMQVRDDYSEYVAKFGQPQVEFDAHYLETPYSAYNEYCQCLGDNCPACQAGIKKVKRKIDFFYHPESDSIVYHPHNFSNKPDSFTIQLAKACLGGYPAILELMRRDQYAIHIERIEQPKALRLNSERVRLFLSDLKEGAIDMNQFVTQLSFESMAAIETIKLRRTIKGLC